MLVGQLPKLFGFSTNTHGLDRRGPQLRAWARRRQDRTSIAIDRLACLGAILALRHWLPKVPGVFLAVVAATAVASAFDLSAHGVAVLGVIPSGFPRASIPRIGVHDAGRWSSPHLAWPSSRWPTRQRFLVA